MWEQVLETQLWWKIFIRRNLNASFKSFPEWSSPSQMKKVRQIALIQIWHNRLTSWKKQQFITNKETLSEEQEEDRIYTIMQDLGQQRIWRLLKEEEVSLLVDGRKMKVLMKMMTSSVQFVWKDWLMEFIPTLVFHVAMSCTYHAFSSFKASQRWGILQMLKIDQWHVHSVGQRVILWKESNLLPKITLIKIHTGSVTEIIIYVIHNTKLPCKYTQFKVIQTHYKNQYSILHKKRFY